MCESIKGKRGVSPTKTVKKVSFGGRLEEYTVYRVNIKHLYYNDKNDRIATWMSQYIEENGDLDKDDEEKYNNIIENFIINSNKQAFKKTCDNIQQIGQREPGVILNDGRVIDGNRRFTCLRQLFKEMQSQEFEYFETIIVDGNIDDKRIKILELDLQHGVDEKVDYNPIDKLVGIYNDVIKKKVLKKEEYQSHINVTPSQMNLMIEKALIMVDFLEFIKAKEKFYIARDMDLDGPLQEIASIKRRYKKEEEWDEIRLTLFAYMVAKPKGDLTRVIRDIGAILKSKKGKDFIEKSEDFSVQIYEAIPDEGSSSQAIRSGLADEKETIIEMANAIDTYRYDANIESIKNKPLQTTVKAHGILEEIDFDIVERLSKKEKDDIREYVKKIKVKVKQLEVMLDA